jgi:hypothetical protein
MKINHITTCLLALAIGTAACTRENDEVVLPIPYEEFPQIIVFDDEEDGDLEDSDEAAFVLTLIDRIDPDGEELGGKIIPLTADVTVEFEVEAVGFSNLADYILGWEASYEVDDCESEDVTVSFDPATGKGSVVFPADVEEIEVVFELNDAQFDDDVQNGDDRGFEVTLTSLNSSGQNVLVNPEAGFEWKVLDDELIFGKWALDLSAPGNFENMKAMLGLVDADIAELNLADVDEVEFEFELLEAKFVIVLKEEETVEECGEIETVNVEIEVETEYEELTDDDTAGEIELVGDVEDDEERVTEFVFKGEFSIENGRLTLTLEAEYDDETVEDIVLVLDR